MPWFSQVYEMCSRFVTDDHEWVVGLTFQAPQVVECFAIQEDDLWSSLGLRHAEIAAIKVDVAPFGGEDFTEPGTGQ